MPLPEKVIEQLGREPTTGTQGWATGALSFAGGILFLALAVYFGLTYGYEPALQKQLSGLQDQVSAADKGITSDQQAQLINFYSRITNLQKLLKNHVIGSQLFAWLEKNTEANVYFQNFNLSVGNKITFTGSALTEADINQQVAIFENAPEVAAVSVSNVTAPALPGQAWTFTAVVTLNSSVTAPATAAATQ